MARFRAFFRLRGKQVHVKQGELNGSGLILQLSGTDTQQADRVPVPQLIKKPAGGLAERLGGVDGGGNRTLMGSGGKIAVFDFYRNGKGGESGLSEPSGNGFRKFQKHQAGFFPGFRVAGEGGS